MQDSKIRLNIQRYYDPLEMPGGWSFNHVEQLKTNILYYFGKYKTGQFDKRGFRKFFYQIIKPTCDIATKFIDLDTKDIILYATQDEQELPVWMMQRKLKQWMKDKGFAELLNEIAVEYPKGHVVIKKARDKWQLVQLTNLRTDIAAQYLHKSDFVYELVGMSRGEIEDSSFSNQDAVKELLERGYEDYLVYECYERSGKKWKKSIRAELWTEKINSDYRRSTEAKFNERSDYLPSLVLDERTVEKLPYRELKWEDMSGRWLGYGFPEYLEDNQIAENEAENLERKALALKALQLWQSRDDTVGGNNALVDAENGDILKVDSEVTLVQKDNSDLAAFNSTRGRWGQNTINKTFTTDVARGDNLPSRTPLGVANIQAGMVKSYFDLKRQNFGIFIKNLLLEDVIPDFKKETYKEHILTFFASDEDIDKLDKFITDIKVGDAAVKHAMKTGFFPSKLMQEDARQRILEQLKKSKNRYLTIPDGFYDNAKYILDINVTGEQVDVGIKGQILQMAMQMIGQGVLQNKTSKKVFFHLLSLGGVSPVEIGLTDNEEVDQTPMMPQGSMAKPAPAMASPFQTTTQL